MDKDITRLVVNAIPPYPSVVKAWIKLPRLLGFWYKCRILEEIEGMVGNVTKLDLNTYSRMRGKFVGMVVYINLDKTLTSQVLINGHLHQVEFESLLENRSQPTKTLDLRASGSKFEALNTGGIRDDNLNKEGETTSFLKHDVMATNNKNTQKSTFKKVPHVVGLGPMGVEVFVEKGMLNPRKNSIVSFRENMDSVGMKVKVVDPVVDLIRASIVKPLIELFEGRGDKFKAYGNAHISLTDFMNSMVELISSQMDIVGDSELKKMEKDCKTPLVPISKDLSRGSPRRDPLDFLLVGWSIQGFRILLKVNEALMRWKLEKSWNVFYIMRSLSRSRNPDANGGNDSWIYDDKPCNLKLSISFKSYMANNQNPWVGFIASRNITDNILIAQEVIHTIRSKHRNRNWMVVKIDLEKAYNKNGAPTQKFKPAKGIRQGCLLLSYLFVLCMKWLSHSFYQAIESGLWRPIRLSRSVSTFSLLFFADDLVIFGHADLQKISSLKDILERFCRYSGYQINGLQPWHVFRGTPSSRKDFKMFLRFVSMMIHKGICDEIECIVRQFIWGSFDVYQKVGLLIDHISAHVNINLDCMLNDMVNEEVSWNLEFFRLWLPKKYGYKLSQMKLVEVCFIEDLLQWVKTNLQCLAKPVVGEEDVSRWKGQSSNVEMLESWINLCTDGVVQIISENTAARGVITIGNKEKIMGYNSNFGKCSVFDTKLWDIFDGLALIHNRSYDGVLI
ncbi:hypothetical protein Goari_024356 [Gossypium aridum]|uniref:Reverse transcriptase domain-containing protein n=1 Tax=Gossypium aridum TaxID=34290 RepID=A0A7J8X6E6_GOSAI|nr:hypothetical protein [Gossypium aridum]